MTARPAAVRGKAAGRGSLLWVQGLACGALLTFAGPAVLVLAVLQAPALACLLGEREAGPGAPRCVALCCGVGSLAPLWRLWMRGGHLAQALDTLSDPAVLVTAWGAGACAWAACQVLPVLIRTAWELRVAARAAAIREELKRCRDEWDVSGDDPAARS